MIWDLGSSAPRSTCVESASTPVRGGKRTSASSGYCDTWKGGESDTWKGGESDTWK